jgi:hypothetical protein
MSDIIETLLLRNLQEVFGEGDPARRRAAIAELYTDDCTVLLPIGRYIGHEALNQVAGELRAGHPSFVYTPHSVPQAVQDGGRIAWGSGPAGKPPRYTGLDVIIVRDGKIAVLYVFLAARMKLDTAVGWQSRLDGIWSSAIAEGRQQASRIEPWRGCGGSQHSIGAIG